MPQISFSEDEIIADGDNNVNSRGMVYVGTKHVGKKARWLIVKGDQTPATTPMKSLEWGETIQ